jgi:tetratricopeptide (TPR) repeat protein
MVMLMEKMGQHALARRYCNGLSAEIRLVGARPNQEMLIAEAAKLLGISVDDDQRTPLQLLEALLTAGTDSAEPYLVVGRTLRSSGQDEAANRAFAAATESLQAVKGNRGTVNYWGPLIEALYESEQYSRAQEALESSMELHRNAAPAINTGAYWWYRAMLLAHAGDHDESQRIFDQLASQLSDSPMKASANQEIYRDRLAKLLRKN